MRSNLDHVRSNGMRHFSDKYGTAEFSLAGAYFISPDGPSYYFINPGGSNRTIFLPPLSPYGGQFYFITNTGLTNSLLVVDADGVAVFTVSVDALALFISSPSGWHHLSNITAAVLLSSLLEQPTVVTSSADTSISGLSKGILFNRSSSLAATNVSLPAVADRQGLPLIVSDWGHNAATYPITLTPSVGETIMGFSTWKIEQDGEGVTLYPVEDLSGWYIAK